jgi:hypothetical protein
MATKEHKARREIAESLQEKILLCFLRSFAAKKFVAR